MKVIVTGSNGFLGQHLVDFLWKKGYEIIGVGRGENRNVTTNGFTYKKLDLTNNEEIVNLIDYIKPEIVIHNAAMSKPDECEDNKEECILQNVTTTKFLVESLRKYDPYFIYVSTDFVFGEGGPHAENNAPNPLNFYGESKLRAEEIVKNSGCLHCIMRPVFIYGPLFQNMKPTFVHWVETSLKQGKQIKVVDDQKRTPTYVYDICNGIETLIQKKMEGSIHLAGKDIISPYQMATLIAKTLQLDSQLITPVTSNTFPEKVTRAKYSGLTIDKAKAVLGYAPLSFEEGIKLTFR